MILTPSAFNQHLNQGLQNNISEDIWENVPDFGESQKKDISPGNGPI